MSIVTNLPITVIVLAHEQNEKLLRCLGSVTWADEVIVFFTGPGECAPPIKLSQLHVICSHQHITDFSAVRNEAMSHAKHDWVFFVDSDEVVDETTLSDLPQLLRSGVSGITVQRRDVFLGKSLHWGEVGHVRFVRLFRKTVGQYVRPVHEEVILDGLIAPSSLVLIHDTHDSIKSFLEKVIVYSRLEAELRIKKNVRVSVFELFAWPLGKFVLNYGIRFGILDGWRGLIYAGMMSIHSFAVRALIYEQHHR